MDDYSYIKAGSKIEQFLDGALDEQITSTLKSRAMVGGLCMLIPLYGCEVIIYVICLWNTYKQIADLCSVPFKNNVIKNVIGAFIINIIVTFILGLVIDLIPGLIISCAGSFVMGYLSIKASGAAYVKALKMIYGSKATKDFNYKQGIANMKNNSNDSGQSISNAFSQASQIHNVASNFIIEDEIE